MRVRASERWRPSTLTITHSSRVVRLSGGGVAVFMSRPPGRRPAWPDDRRSRCRRPGAGTLRPDAGVAPRSGRGPAPAAGDRADGSRAVGCRAPGSRRRRSNPRRSAGGRARAVPPRGRRSARRIPIRVPQLDLVLDAPEERLVHEVLGIQVAGEHEQAVEGDLELESRVQRQVIHLVFEGEDPPAEDLRGRGPLPSEVVEDEGTAHRLELRRGPIDAADGIEAEIEILQLELPAGDHDGPLDEDVAMVEREPTPGRLPRTTDATRLWCAAS